MKSKISDENFNCDWRNAKSQQQQVELVQRRKNCAMKTFHSLLIFDVQNPLTVNMIE